MAQSIETGLRPTRFRRDSRGRKENSTARGTLKALRDLIYMEQRKRELYEGSNGDRWFLGRDAIGELVVIHEPNAASGGRVSSMLVDTFMMATNRGPQHQALQNLIGTLVPKKPGES